MKLPSLLRPHATFAPLNLSDDDLLHALARQLERRGARGVTFGDASVACYADDMAFNVSPLGTCTDAAFTIRRTPERTRVEYSLSLDLLTGRAALCLCVLAAICAPFIFHGLVAPAAIAALFYVGGVAGTYLLASDQMRRIIEAALAPVAPPRAVRFAARPEPRRPA